MPSLQVRRLSLRVRPLVVLSNIVSSLIAVVLLCAVWVGVSYVKNRAANQRSLIAPPVSASSTAGANSTAVRLSATEKTEPPASTRPVYSCAADKTYYHDSKHLQLNCDRVVSGEDAAASRGLKPCPRCFAKQP